MLELSPDTIERVHAVFSASQWPAVENLLLNHAVFSGMTSDWAELAERVRFAVLKLSCGNLDSLSHQLDEARIDWRDTLMAAGFGHETSAHKRWKP